MIGPSEQKPLPYASYVESEPKYSLAPFSDLLAKITDLTFEEQQVILLKFAAESLYWRSYQNFESFGFRQAHVRFLEAQAELFHRNPMLKPVIERLESGCRFCQSHQFQSALGSLIISGIKEFLSEEDCLSEHALVNYDPNQIN